MLALIVDPNIKIKISKRKITLGNGLSEKYGCFKASRADILFFGS